MVSISLLTSLTLLGFVAGINTHASQNGQTDLLGVPSTTAMKPKARLSGTIALEDALSIAMSVQHEQHQQMRNQLLASAPDFTPDAGELSMLVGLTGPVQAHNDLHSGRNLTEMLELLTPPSQQSRSHDDEGLKRQSALRVLVVGDSMTQGQEGDFTWRYRMWQWFQANGIAVTFVGPYVGTAKYVQTNPPPPQPPALFNAPPPVYPLETTGLYAAGTSGFSSNHFSLWGRPAAIDKDQIADVVRNNPADLMLLMLGFNDMGWFYSDAPGTLASIQTLINNARGVNPNMKFAVASVPQRLYIPGRQDLVDNTLKYNQLLANAVPQWNTAQSPVHYAPLAENYQCAPASCPAGYDGLHPNELGEYQIARAFSLCLYNDFKLGNGPLVVPSYVPPRSLPVPSNFKVFSSPQGVSATWDPVFGAYSYDVQSSINGGTTWDFSGSTSRGNRWDSNWAVDGWTYDLQVRAIAGPTRQGGWTADLSAVAHPQTAAAPNNVRVTAGSSSVTITWDPPTGPYTDSIVEYNVIFYDIDGCAFLGGGAFTSSPATITGLNTGHQYFFLLETWNKNGAGFPMAPNQAIIGYGTPSAPTGLVVDSLDATSIHLTWNSDAGAASYALWVRNINDPSSVSTRQNNTMAVPCDEGFFLFPGTWNYEFCISALNGNSESPKGQCLVAPSPTSSRAPPGCPTIAIPPASCSVVSSAVYTGTVIPTTATTTTSASGSTASPWPIVTNGQCRGSDCQGGRCVGPLCASFGCKGSDCGSNGVCSGPNCISLGCIGPNCNNGVCIGLGCITIGCIGPDCSSGGSGQCTGARCISIGCTGSDCGSNGVCISPTCSESWCLGLGCANGICSSQCSGGGLVNGGGGGGGNSATKQPTSCATTLTASNCNANCNVIVGEGALTTTCGSKSCSATTTGCGVRGTTVSTLTTWSCISPQQTEPPPTVATTAGGQSTSYISCSTQVDPAAAVPPRCVCSGSTFALSTDNATPQNSCAYTAKPTTTLATTGGSQTTSYISCSTSVDPAAAAPGYCICSGSRFPLSTNNATPKNSCAYTTKPTTTV